MTIRKLSSGKWEARERTGGRGSHRPSRTFARRGGLRPRARHDSTWFAGKRGQHSAKPEAFLDLVEQVSPGPYVELFARRDRLGWDTWGNESLGTAEMAA